ncbi:MAG: hypothetical protein HY874_07760 [Chloroflexi bacterium]|nr:hypothetical protein [Chloroflexota bacterium]
MSIQHQPNPKHAAPAAGGEVYSSEGLPVGKIARVSGRFMRIDAPMQPDYWLCVDDIVSLDDGAVTLAYPHPAVPQHKLHAPRSDQAPDPGVDPILLDEQEQLRQREMLERQLEEQHRRMAERRAQAAGVAPGSAAEEERARMEAAEGRPLAPPVARPEFERSGAAAAGPPALLYLLGALTLLTLLAVLVRRRRRARLEEETM